MNENIYMLPDSEIYRLIGKRIRQLRLNQNITQMSLAEQSQISVSSVKKIETGNIGSFDSLVRVLRILGELDVFSQLIKDEDMSPNEYLRFVETAKKKQRKRAKSKKDQSIANNQEEIEW